MNRILLVEDNPINQKLALRLLVSLGYDADLAENGEEALIFLTQGHRPQDYAAVLMDLQMPVMDGMTAARAIRGLEGPASRIPIIALTANSSERDRQRCLAAGMNDFLTKPIDNKKFAAALDYWTAAQLTA